MLGAFRGTGWNVAEWHGILQATGLEERGLGASSAFQPASLVHAGRGRRWVGGARTWDGEWRSARTGHGGKGSKAPYTQWQEECQAWVMQCWGCQGADPAQGVTWWGCRVGHGVGAGSRHELTGRQIREAVRPEAAGVFYGPCNKLPQTQWLKTTQVYSPAQKLEIQNGS